MSKRYRRSDPTAEAAISNADRDARLRREHRDALARRKRPFMKDFEHELDGLLPMEARKVALRALVLADNDVWAIQKHHVRQARREVIDGSGFDGDAA